MKKSFKKKIQKLIVSKVSESEMKYVNALIKILEKRKVRAKAITNRQIQGLLEEKFNLIFHEASVRRYINYIRVTHLLENLISCSHGYYLAQTPEEVSEYVRSLQHRAFAIWSVIESYDI